MHLLDGLLKGADDGRRDATRRVRATVAGEPRGPGWLGAAALAGLAGLAGAVAAALLDPARGRGRRARLVDQGAATVRRAGRRIERVATRVQGDVVGRISAARNAGSGGDRAIDDVTLTDRVQSKLFRDPSVPKGTINVNIERGIVILRGEVPDEAVRDELAARAAQVSGVWSVHNLLHLPGEPANERAEAPGVAGRS